MKSLTIQWHILWSDWSVRPIIRTAFSCKNVLRYFGKVQRNSNVCIIRFDWLIALYLFIPLVCNASFLIEKKVCQGKTQWCQQIIVQEHLVGEFALVHLTFGSFTSPTENFPFAYHPFDGPGMCAVDNFLRLIFGNSQSPDKFTGKRKTQIVVYVYIYIVHHLWDQ